MRLDGAARLLGRVVKHRSIPGRNTVLRERRFPLAKPIERQERVPQDLKQPGSEVGSRLETVGKPESAEVGFLDEVVRLRGISRQIHREVVQRVQVLERGPMELGGRMRPSAVSIDWSSASNARGPSEVSIATTQLRNQRCSLTVWPGSLSQGSAS